MKCKVRGTSSGLHDTPVTFAFTFNGVSDAGTTFTITTHSEDDGFIIDGPDFITDGEDFITDGAQQ